MPASNREHRPGAERRGQNVTALQKQRLPIFPLAPRRFFAQFPRDAIPPNPTSRPADGRGVCFWLGSLRTRSRVLGRGVHARRVPHLLLSFPGRVRYQAAGRQTGRAAPRTHRRKDRAQRASGGGFDLQSSQSLAPVRLFSAERRPVPYRPGGFLFVISTPRRICVLLFCYSQNYMVF